MTYLTYFGSVWPILTYFDLFCPNWPNWHIITNFHVFWPIGSIILSLLLILTYFDLFWPILPLWPVYFFLPILIYFDLFWPILTYFDPFWPMETYFETILSMFCFEPSPTEEGPKAPKRAPSPPQELEGWARSAQIF